MIFCDQKGRAWVTINLGNLRHNVEQFRKILPETCRLMPAVKADAYGHKACIIGKALWDMGVRDFCVASVEEAVELREYGITGQILILGYTPASQFEELVRYDLTQTAVDYAYAKELNAFGKRLLVHVGIDTGMHRLGERCESRENIFKIWELENLKITGVFSHLCVSDGMTKKAREYTFKQIRDFDEIVKELHNRGIDGFKTHLQGSYGVLNYPELSYDYARVGIALYGVLSSPGDLMAADISLRPVLSLRARLVCVKELHEGETAGYGLSFRAPGEMKIGVVSIGYADGIPRELSNRGHALVKGRRVPIIGRVCMDQLIVDVSEAADAVSGDEVVFIGESGDERIKAEELAKEAGTISNEILSGIGKRVLYRKTK